ncbi:transcription factor bHLH25-like isoform X3 [Carya illinoinensis]|uniref:transcription factor bHLH25-like isoform X3 n=1 Tax=Carya illinoinensis TaxID=32201 RepID=UPI001C727625|nr:transcription factor bHLH25-like isoform X3 [Carya illinoinensis]
MQDSHFSLELFLSIRRRSSMEISSIRGLTHEMDMEDPRFTSQWHMNSVDELSIPPLAATFEETLQQYSFTHPNFNLKNAMATSRTDYANQMGILKPKEETAVCFQKFNTLPSDILISQDSLGNQDYGLKACQGGRSIRRSTRHSQTPDHVIAERKRREKLSQRFIALSALIPGLKKTDKASVLGDAIKYLQQLQERVKTLEEQTKKINIESVFLKKSQLFVDGENSISGENFSSDPLDEHLPEIEARFCDKNVLIRVHCEKRKGVAEKSIAEIEMLHLTVINSSVITFGSSALDITIIAQMDEGFSMTVKDLVRSLRSAFEFIM